MSSAVAVGRVERIRRTYPLEEVTQRVDALALTIGTKATASALLLGCVVVILIGAQSLLSTLQGMDRDIKVMNEQLAIANGGLDVLNKTMDSLPPTAQHMSAIVKTVGDTDKQVRISGVALEKMTHTTAKMNSSLGSIAESTTAMRGSLEGASKGTDQLATTIDDLNGDIGPLVKTQHQMFLGTKQMRAGLDAMNASLAYTIRIMNYITAPPHGGGMTIRADLPKETLPPIPGIKAEVKPVPVFPRNAWPVYTGP
jgi:methyl-accepting chemotaxis protein